LWNRHPQERGDRAPCSRVRQRRKPTDGWLPSPTRSDSDHRSDDCAPAISQHCLARLRPEEWFSMEKARWTNCRRAARDARNSSLYPGAPPKAFRLKDLDLRNKLQKTSALSSGNPIAVPGEQSRGAPGSARRTNLPVESICFQTRRKWPVRGHIVSIMETSVPSGRSRSLLAILRTVAGVPFRRKSSRGWSYPFRKSASWAARARLCCPS